MNQTTAHKQSRYLHRKAHWFELYIALDNKEADEHLSEDSTMARFPHLFTNWHFQDEFSAYTQRKYQVPEEKLAIAVIERAYKDEDWEWFSNDSNEPRSFNFLCTYLSINPQWAKRKILSTSPNASKPYRKSVSSEGEGGKIGSSTGLKLISSNSPKQSAALPRRVHRRTSTQPGVKRLKSYLPKLNPPRL